MPPKLSRPEQIMYDTIVWLLNLPEEERELMEAAEHHTFTMASPAPGLGAALGAADALCAMMQMRSAEAAGLLVQMGFRPALLNFAHGYNCGGGFDHAAGSQEEDIFRKTSIFLSLWPHRRVDDGPGILKRGKWIGEFDTGPLKLDRKEPFYEHTECGGIYSPHVRIIEGLPRDVRTCPTIAVLTLAAQNVGFAGPFNPALLREKIRTALWMAASQGHDAAVLGAFGCGYFGNPPEVVAETFAELLGPGGEFARAFRLVVFAVPRDANYRYFSSKFPEKTPTQITALLKSAAA